MSAVPVSQGMNDALPTDPEPPAAPAERVVRPAAAQSDADGEERPRNRGPRPRPARPRGVEAAASRAAMANRRRPRSRRSPCKARWVEHHAGVLQQRIQVAALGRGRHQALEWVGRERKNNKKPTLTSPITGITRASRCRQVFEKSVTAKLQPPSISVTAAASPRASPCRGDAIVQRQLGVGVGGHVLHRKSLATNDHARQANARATSRNWARAAGRASAISRGSRIAAPSIGNVPCTSAVSSATISAK